MIITRALGCALFLLSCATVTNAALAADNCGDQKNSLKKQWENGVVRFGSCYSLTPDAADADGFWFHCGEVAAAGGVHPLAGHRTVAAWVEVGGQVIPLSDNAFYLGYCAANTAPGPVDSAKAIELKKQIDELAKTTKR
jgi:hypothetical protein